ncbi:helix-turn-helix transcriptional regulator [Actinomadura sp. KC06]|uniref:helix-turn-helix transcriptional regulator n=1 Tax=Actinomadura sp. KC06 TaxID=2530369 RepID=UPI0010452970|nr:helix-turn-helix transcriptional regulator [Actinomadura sp. KC06]TDD34140.1 helix-turn-helix transcriptional regulator [Actinomadura sp. KC06]
MSESTAGRTLCGVIVVLIPHAAGVVVEVSLDRLARELHALAEQGVSVEELTEVLCGAIGSQVAHDVLRLVHTNPAAGLWLGSLRGWHRDGPELAEELVLDRFADGDPCRPDDLARRPVPVGVVGVGGGDGPRQRRTREILAAHGVGSELRLLVRDRRGVWGFVGVARAEGARPFDQDEMARLARLGPVLAATFRTFMGAQPLAPGVPALPAGVIIVGADHTVQQISPQAKEWLEQVWLPRQRGVTERALAPFAAEISHHTRENIADPGAWKPWMCLSKTSAGRWIALQGQPLDADGSGEVAIVVQAAGGELLLTSFCHWHEITARERQVIEQLCTATPPKRIARALEMSVHTVNQHLKTIYRKTGADGRDELLAALAS